MAKTIGLKIEVLGSEEQVRELQKLQRTIDKLQAKNKELASTIGKGSEEYQKNNAVLKETQAQYRANQKQVQVTTEGARALGNSYNDLTEKNRRLSVQLRQLADPLGKDANEFKRLSNEINGNTDKLKQMDSAMGRSFRNVGNYAEGIIKAEKALRGEKKELEQNIRALKIAAQQTARNTNEQNKIQKELQESQIKYRQVNAELAKFDATNKAGFAGIQKSIGGLKSLGLALGAGLFGVTALASGIRSSIKTVLDFQQANAQLAATLGRSRSDIKELTEDALRLGSTTEYTSTQVSSLQTELAKLGFSTTEILNATGAVLNLATVAGVDLSEAASVAGSTVRAFGLDAVETQRVVDVMAKSFTSSALDMEKFATSMRQVAPVAKTFGFSVEDTTALLGTLVDAGFDASQAGTSLRNIFLNLADTGGALAQRLGGSVNSFDKLIPALIKLREEGVDLNETLSLTDKRSVAAFNRFLDGAESAEVLRNKVNDAFGTAFAFAEEKLNTVEGSTIKLSSAWDGFVNTLITGDSVITNVAKAGIDGLSKSIVELTELLKFGLETVEEREARSLEKRNKAADDYAAQIAARGNEFIEQERRKLEATIAANNIRILNGTKVEEMLFKTRTEFMQRVLDQLDEIQKKEIEGTKKKTGKGGEIDILKEIYDFSKLTNLELKNRIDHQKDLIKRGEADATLSKEAKEEKNRLIKALELELSIRKKIHDEASSVFREEQSFRKVQENINDEIDRIFREEAITAEKAFTDEFEIDPRDLFPEEIAPDFKDLDEAKKKAKIIADEEDKIRKTAQQAALKSTQDISDAVFEIEKEAINRRAALAIEVSKRQYDTELKILDEKFRDGIIAEAQFRDEKNKLDIKQAARERAIQKKAFNQQKEASIVQSIINGALAVGNVWAQNAGQPIVAAILTAVAVAATAAQTAVIASQQFAKGGVLPAKTGGIIEGESHANGGVKFISGGRLMEAEGGEIIINKRSAAMFRPQLSAINQAGGGVAFADGGYIPKFQTGVRLPVTRTLTPNTATVINDVVEDAAVLTQNLRVTVVEADITDTQERIAVNESQGGF